MLNNTNTTRIPVYFIPGLAAGKEIFEYISLPEELYEVHIIEWIIPEKKETIEQYARRMAELVKKPNPILNRVMSIKLTWPVIGKSRQMAV